MPILLTSSLFAEKTPVAGANSDLPADPKALFGQMDNGFKYVIYPNNEPPKRFSVRLHIDAGSLMENDDQRGLAHFLEHMVFNGSKHFTPAELIPKMQRLGISFGAHANAYTSFDETVYMLDLPNMDADTVDLTFNVMRDFADGALLSAEEIENERGVIISEKTSRDSVDYRMMIKQYEYLLPGSRIFQRLPIGEEEVIKNAPRERFTEFYNDFYTPENMTLVVVGDFDPAEMEKRVRESFISMMQPEKPGEFPAADHAPKGHGFQSEIFADKEIAADSLTLYSLRNYTVEADTAANRQKQLPLALANAMLSRRLEILAKKENSPIVDGGAGRFVLFNQIETGVIEVQPAVNKWVDAVPILEQEMRRAVEFGFTNSELAEARAKILNAAEQAVKRASTRESDSLASSIAGAVNDARVFTTPETNLEVVQAGLEKMTPAECHQAFKDFWNTEDLSLVLTTNKKDDAEKEKLTSLFKDSSAVAIEAPSEAATQQFAYGDFGAPGTVVSENKVEDFATTQLVLSNNVRVNLKPTDFEKNNIRLRARIGSGQLTMPEDKPGLDQFASVIFDAGGLGKHSADELQRLLAGRNVGTGFGVEEESFVLGGRTTPKDLELQLQLMCAALTDPGYREEAVRQYKKMIPNIYNQMAHSMQGSMVTLNEELHGGDYRFVMPPLEKALSYTSDDVKTWLTPALEKAPLELTLVGDFDPAMAIPLILKTFGALPERESEKELYDEKRQFTFPKTPDNKTLTFDSKIPNAAAMVVWQIPDARKEIKTTRRFNIIGEILSNRLREEIREKLGGSYSPNAGASASFNLNFGVLQAMAQVKPGETEKYGQLIIKIADAMAQKDISEDELERALKPTMGNLQQSLRSNDYWLNTVLTASQEQPKLLDWARERDEDYGNITVDELNKLAAEFLTKDKALLYQLVPEEKK